MHSVGGRMRANDGTARKKKTIDTLLSTKIQSKTAHLLRIGFDRVHRVMHRFVKVGLFRRTPEERYYYLSIDGKAVHKGHDYVSILSEESSGIVIDVVEGRSEESVDELCQTALGEAQRKDVISECTDMWQPCIKG